MIMANNCSCKTLLKTPKSILDLNCVRCSKPVYFFSSAYIVWGLLLSLQPPFYPSEAERKGATPSQVSIKVFKIK